MTSSARSTPPVIPDLEVLDEYDDLPEPVPLDMTEDTVKAVAGKYSGAAGLGGIDAAELQQKLLRFGVASQRMRIAVASLVICMANDISPIAATHSLLTNRLMVLDKYPGIRLISIGEICCRLLAKCVLKVAGSEAKGVQKRPAQYRPRGWL